MEIVAHVMEEAGGGGRRFRRPCGVMVEESEVGWKMKRRGWMRLTKRWE